MRRTAWFNLVGKFAPRAVARLGEKAVHFERQLREAAFQNLVQRRCGRAGSHGWIHSSKAGKGDRRDLWFWQEMRLSPFHTIWIWKQFQARSQW